MTQKQRQAYTLKKRADEARIQQLRGIFAAYDEDRDGVLNSRCVEVSSLVCGPDGTKRGAVLVPAACACYPRLL
jgi:hypothetical protein